MSTDHTADDSNCAAGKKSTAETKTDYTEKETKITNSPATNYEESLESTMSTADTSVNALKEKHENPEEDSATEKKTGPAVE